jgi:hypothetical protein
MMHIDMIMNYYYLEIINQKKEYLQPMNIFKNSINILNNLMKNPKLMLKLN